MPISMVRRRAPIEGLAVSAPTRFAATEIMAEESCRGCIQRGSVQCVSYLTARRLKEESGCSMPALATT